MTQVTNLIVVDIHVGVGYSYSSTKGGYADTQQQVAEDLLALRDVWFRRAASRFQSSRLTTPFFLAGEFYAGKYIPDIRAAIVARGSFVKYRFNRAAIGNGLTDPQLVALTIAASYYSIRFNRHEPARTW